MKRQVVWGLVIGIVVIGGVSFLVWHAMQPPAGTTVERSAEDERQTGIEPLAVKSMETELTGSGRRKVSQEGNATEPIDTPMDEVQQAIKAVEDGSQLSYEEQLKQQWRLFRETAEFGEFHQLREDMARKLVEIGEISVAIDELRRELGQYTSQSRELQALLESRYQGLQELNRMGRQSLDILGMSDEEFRIVLGAPRLTDAELARVDLSQLMSSGTSPE